MVIGAWRRDAARATSRLARVPGVRNPTVNDCPFGFVILGAADNPHANAPVTGTNKNRRIFGSAISVGSFLAFALSWFDQHSFPWAVVHAVYSWFYVAYYASTKSGAMRPIETTAATTAAAVLVAVLVGLTALIAGLVRRRP
jgi:hypothetical protein